MGIFTMCPACGSDWCTRADCVRISPENLRKLAKYIPNSGYVGDLRQLASYFESNPQMFKEAMTAVMKDNG